MPVKIDNLSGLNYDDEIEFNEKELQELILFNGFPINTETFPTSSDYIWSFYTASSVENLNSSNPSGDVAFQDFTQSIATLWEPSGWYGQPDIGTFNTNGITTTNGISTAINKVTTWCVINRLGLGDEGGPGEGGGTFGFNDNFFQGHTELVLLGLEHLTSSIYENAQACVGLNASSFNSHMWKNGITPLVASARTDPVFQTRHAHEGETNEKVMWTSSDASAQTQVVGYGLGGTDSNTTITRGATPSQFTGPYGGPSASRSPFIHSTAPIPNHPTDGTSTDRFIYAEESEASSVDYRVVRTPQRIFSFHSSQGISRKFIGFYYHAYSNHNAFGDMAQQVVNGESYITTVWATQYRQTSLRTTNYTHNNSGTVFNNHLVRFVGAIGSLFVQLQKPPTFVGGIKLSDIGTYISQGNTSHWSEFNGFFSDWKSKVLEVPDSAFDYEGEITVDDDGPLSASYIKFPPSDFEQSKLNGMYFYIVTSPPTHEKTDISFANLQIAEYDNAFVPQSILDQLE